MTAMEETPAQRQLRNEQVKAQELETIKQGGNTSISPAVMRSVGLPGMTTPVPPVVILVTGSQEVLIFQTREELAAFIAELQDSADEAWPV